MRAKLNRALYPSPTIYNLFKPAGPSSGVVLGKFKRLLPKGYGKVGHFGTLDPFACGVFLIGVAGASRFNDLIHLCYPKTYIAVGKLGVKSPAGDYTHPEKFFDESEYLKTVIACFDRNFIQEQVLKKFEGEYWQAPPAYSAAKFEGKPLHEWAREGKVIPKEKVRREIHQIEVMKYCYPFLSIKVTASSGTYIRTLFEDIAHKLGTYGMLTALVRTQIGPCTLKDSLRLPELERSPEEFVHRALNIESVLAFEQCEVAESQELKFTQGVQIYSEQSMSLPLGPYVWVKGPSQIIRGLARWENHLLLPHVIFS